MHISMDIAVCFNHRAVGILRQHVTLILERSYSGALVSMTSETLSGTDWYSLSALQTGIFVSGSLGGALVASAIALVRLFLLSLQS